MGVGTKWMVRNGESS